MIKNVNYLKFYTHLYESNKNSFQLGAEAQASNLSHCEEAEGAQAGRLQIQDLGLGI